MNIIDHLRTQAEARPDAPAIIDTHRGRRRVLTFAALDNQSARVAALLHQSVLRPGEAVLLLQPMSAELYVALAALFRLGLTAVVLDPSAGRAHVAACSRMHPIQGFIGSTKAHALRLLVPEIRRIPHRFVIGGPVPGAQRWRPARHLSPHETAVPCTADRPALLTFTSGSTGQPKAAVRSHGLLLAQYDALRRCLDLQPGQVDLATLPIFVLANLAAGVTSVIPRVNLRQPGRVAPGPLLDQIQAENVMRIGASPAFMERLLTHPATEPLRHLTHLYAGGAPVFPTLMQRLQAAAPHSRVVAVYGSTEAEPMAHVAWQDLARQDLLAMRNGRGLLAGPPVPDVDLRILPDRWGTPLGSLSPAAFDATCLPPGQPGEIVVSGAHVVPGYLNGRGDAETKFDVEDVRWHRTGDAGYLDTQGRLWLLGRCEAKVVQPDGSLYPFAVESAAQAHPGVRRTAFAAHRGRRLLLIEPEQGMAPDAPAIHQSLAWAGLDAVQIVRRLPVDRRHNAKIDYPALRRLLDRQTA